MELSFENIKVNPRNVGIILDDKMSTIDYLEILDKCKQNGFRTTAICSKEFYKTNRSRYDLKFKNVIFKNTDVIQTCRYISKLGYIITGSDSYESLISKKILNSSNVNILNENPEDCTNIEQKINKDMGRNPLDNIPFLRRVGNGIESSFIYSTSKPQPPKARTYKNPRSSIFTGPNEKDNVSISDDRKHGRVNAALIPKSRNLTGYADILRAANLLTTYLDSMDTGKILLIFEHGLGDYIMFLDIFNELIFRYPNIDFNLGYARELNLGCLHEKMYPLDVLSDNFKSKRLHLASNFNKYDLTKLVSDFKYVFNIQYPEKPNKTTNCNKIEIGMSGNIFAHRYEFNTNILSVENTKKVGLHLFANSGTRLDSKNASIEEYKDVYKYLCDSDEYDPVIFYNRFMTEDTKVRSADTSWIKKEHLIKENSTVEDLINYISELKFFIGPTSGPLVMARKILGESRCLGISSQYSININNVMDTGNMLMVPKGGNIKTYLNKMEK